MRVLITGGAGFIGSHLAEFHLERGDEVHCVDDLSTGTVDNVALFRDRPGYSFDRADIRTWEGLEPAMAGVDRVYHMAAVVGMFRVLAEPEAVLATNVAGTERVLRCAAESGARPRVLIASSSEVYGPVGTHRLDETDALVGGGWVADAPGWKSLALWDTEPEEIDAYFPELAPLVEECQFSDCGHTHEPKCAVLAAIAAGTVSRQRYESYLRLKEDE